MSRQQISNVNVTFIWSLLTSLPLFSVEDISWGLWIAESMERGGIWIERNSTILCQVFLGVLGWYNIIDMGHVVDTVISHPDFHCRAGGFTSPIARRAIGRKTSNVICLQNLLLLRSNSAKVTLQQWLIYMGYKKCWPPLLDSGQLWRIIPALQLPRELVKPPLRLHWCSASLFV